MIKNWGFLHIPVDGQQVATRLDDDSLYYHVNDPTGTSLVMVDEDGEEAGRMLYDGFGGVLTSTMPITLTGALPDTPDAATGLVHLGGGRWYDPALGRPLQPNPMGGPPTVPQALNRYAATPMGQPGVYQAVSSRSDFGLWAQQQAIKVPISQALGGNAFAWGAKETGWLRVSIRAEKRLIPKSLQHLDLISSQSPGFKRRTRALFNGDGFFRSIFSDAYHIEARAGRVHQSALNLRLSDVANLNLRVLERETVDIFRISGKAILGDLTLGIGLDVAFQILDDWDDPYLNTTQFASRAFVAGVGGSISGGVGLGMSGILILAGVGTGPAGWIGLGVGLGVDWLWGSSATPWIYENFGLNPKRNLQPMGG